MLVVGVPKEMKAREKRVGLTPEGVTELTRQGITVLVQKDAGELSGFADEEYRESGARIAATLEDLYDGAEVIQKVKEPQAIEYPLLRDKHVLFCFLHLASQEGCECVRALLTGGVTAIGYETLDLGGRLPLLKPMSEIAGGLSVSYGAYLASLNFKDKIDYPENFQSVLQELADLYPRGSTKYRLGQTVIWGGGVAGEAALRMAIGLSSKTIVIEKVAKRREELVEQNGSRGDIECLDPSELKHAQVEAADLFVGCVHSRGCRALKVMDDTFLKSVSGHKRKVIMDVSIDQGGNFPEAYATTYDDPLFLDSYGNSRFCVANMPSLCGRAASEALTLASSKYLAALANGVDHACQQYPELVKAMNVQHGKILLESVKIAHQYR